MTIDLNFPSDAYSLQSYLQFQKANLEQESMPFRDERGISQPHDARSVRWRTLKSRLWQHGQGSEIRLLEARYLEFLWA
jgi:hypothetical protein